jgi:hypothetical protein
MIAFLLSLNCSIILDAAGAVNWAFVEEVDAGRYEHPLSTRVRLWIQSPIQRIDDQFTIGIL